MAVVCVIPEHPVGAGAFCRICGRSYVNVADPVPGPVAAPLPEPVAAPLPDMVAAPPAEPDAFVSAPQPPPLPPMPPMLPPPLPAFPEAATTEQTLPEQVMPEQVMPEQVTPELPAAELATDALPEETSHAPAARSLPPSVVHALAGFGGGAVVMAVLDRLVL